jgi:class 3 adenylate cyclase/tetratricopeptide (TPR) repeat protein
MSASTAILASYLPALLVRRFAANPEPLTTPHAERFPAAVLFADISGFTRLTEKLAARGPAGVEQLSRVLNTSFSRLIDTLTSHGGDVIKFAGDALLAVWKDDGKSSAVCVLRAAHCALALQKAFQEVATFEDLTLSLKISVGAGPLLTATIGGERGRWEFMVAGSPWEQIGLMDHHAQAGQVLLSNEAWALVPDQCEGVAIMVDGHPIGMQLRAAQTPVSPTALFRPALPLEAEPALRGFIPGAALMRLQAGQAGWMAELRRLTVVFLNVRGLDFAAPEAVEQLHSVMRALQTVLYRYEGSVNQFLTDDKGTSLLAAFGLPPLAHEDDPVRGVQAALDLQTELRKLNLDCAIGVATGRAFCGARGNDTRREYAILGDVVNLAARLMQAAETVLCDAPTQQAAQARLNFETLAPITAKGKAELVAVFRPVAETRAAFAPIPAAPAHGAEMVGRQFERKTIATQLAALERGTSSVILIEGEAGIGKSRLVADLREQAAALNLTVFTGAATPMEANTAYFVWRAVFDQLYDLGLLTDPAARGQHVLNLLEDAPDLAALAPLLTSILLLDLPENEQTARMEGQVRADNTRDLLIRILQESAARSPKVIVLDDAHWLDSASWALAWQVAQRVWPTVLVIVARPLGDAPPDEYRQLAAGERAYPLRLEALTSAEAAALVCQRLGVEALPKPVLQLIRAKTEGHPFFAEELAYALRDSGLLQIEGRECRLTPNADLNAIVLPDTVEGVVTSRIDRLTPQQQLTLKTASVIGRVFPLRVLRVVHPIEQDRPHLETHLDSLARLELTQTETPAPDRADAFRHVITQEVAYNLMAFAQRRTLHRAIAEWHEQAYAENLEAYYSLLAYHWQKADDATKTLEYAGAAGEFALRNGVYEEAVEHLRHAIELAEAQAVPSAQVAHWEHLLGEAYNNLGRKADERQHLQRALRLLDQPVPTTTLSIAWEFARELLLFPFRFARPPAQSHLSESEHATTLEIAQCYRGLLINYFLDSRLLPTLHSNFRAFNVTVLAGDSPELIRAYGSLLGTLVFARLYGLAEVCVRRAEDLMRRLNDPASRSWFYDSRGIWSVGVRPWAEAQRDLQESLEISTGIGDRRQQGDALTNIGAIHLYQGEFSAVSAIADQIYRLGVESANIEHQAFGLNIHIMLAWRVGDLTRALTLGEQVLALHQHLKASRIAHTLTYGALINVHLRLHQLSAAQGLADQLTEFVWPLVIYYESVDIYQPLTEVRLALWERSTKAPSTSRSERAYLRAQARQALGWLWQFALQFAVGRPAAWRMEGRWAWLNGRHGWARFAWRRAIADARRLQMPFDEAQALFDLGRHSAGAERKELLQSALEIFERLGAKWDVKEVKEATNEFAAQMHKRA